jgi:hypothetical protein
VLLSDEKSLMRWPGPHVSAMVKYQMNPEEVVVVGRLALPPLCTVETVRDSLCTVDTELVKEISIDSGGGRLLGSFAQVKVCSCRLWNDTWTCYGHRFSTMMRFELSLRNIMVTTRKTTSDRLSRNT